MSLMPVISKVSLTLSPLGEKPSGTNGGQFSVPISN